ncbi:MAG: aspartate kinase, partial [Bacteroidales bacterium]|nr:aspartate kinase [Bacteroidales bacterium]
MKILKFGGTSVGSAERIKTLSTLIRNGEQKLVVLSAMSGTTNALVEIADKFRSGNQQEASSIIDDLRRKYHIVVKDLLSSDDFLARGVELIESHFDHLSKISPGDFSRRDE